MCTVLLRFSPGTRWPLLVGAVRDEFLSRPWQPPALHWDQPVVGGRDLVAGGTWLAVDPAVPAVAALLNGPPLPVMRGVVRPTRGTLPLAALAGALPDDYTGYDRFHLLHADAGAVTLRSWDGRSLTTVAVPPGDHIVVNAGLDAADDPLVPHFAPLLAATDTDLAAWRELLAGDGLDPGDPRALVIRRDLNGIAYGSGSATLVALGADGTAHYDFTANPGPSAEWYEVSM